MWSGLAPSRVSLAPTMALPAVFAYGGLVHGATDDQGFDAKNRLCDRWFAFVVDALLYGSV